MKRISKGPTILEFELFGLCLGGPGVSLWSFGMLFGEQWIWDSHVLTKGGQLVQKLPNFYTQSRVISS